MKKRFSEEQFIGFRREVDAGMPIMARACIRFGIQCSMKHLSRSRPLKLSM